MKSNNGEKGQSIATCFKVTMPIPEENVPNFRDEGGWNGAFPVASGVDLGALAVAFPGCCQIKIYLRECGHKFVDFLHLIHQLPTALYVLPVRVELGRCTKKKTFKCTWETLPLGLNIVGMYVSLVRVSLIHQLCLFLRSNALKGL